MGAEKVVLPANHGSHHETVPQLQRFFHRVREAAHDAFLDNNAVHHHFDGVLLILFQFDFIGKRDYLSVHSHPDIAFLPELFQQLLVGAFFWEATGPSTMSFVLSPSAIRASTIWSTVCRWMGLPQ